MSDYANLDDPSSIADVVDYSDTSNQSKFAGSNIDLSNPTEVDSTIRTQSVVNDLEAMGMGGERVIDEDSDDDIEGGGAAAAATPNFDLSMGVDDDIATFNIDLDDDSTDDMQKYAQSIDREMASINGGECPRGLSALTRSGGGIWSSRPFNIAVIILIAILSIKGGYDIFVPGNSEVQCPASADANVNNNNVDDPLRNYRQYSQITDLRSAAIASDTPLCSDLGRSIMEDSGGNAVDAAVATALCLGVANMASSGFGGGGFILVSDGTEEVFIDGRYVVILLER